MLSISGFQIGPAAARIKKRRQQKAKQEKPPWGPGRRLVLGPHVGDDFQRREVDSRGLRRRDAKKQPDAGRAASAMRTSGAAKLRGRPSI